MLEELRFECNGSCRSIQVISCADCKWKHTHRFLLAIVLTRWRIIASTSEVVFSPLFVPLSAGDGDEVNQGKHCQIVHTVHSVIDSICICSLTSILCGHRVPLWDLWDAGVMFFFLFILFLLLFYFCINCCSLFLQSPLLLWYCKCPRCGTDKGLSYLKNVNVKFTLN